MLKRIIEKIFKRHLNKPFNKFSKKELDEYKKLASIYNKSSEL